MVDIHNTMGIHWGHSSYGFISFLVYVVTLMTCHSTTQDIHEEILQQGEREVQQSEEVKTGDETTGHNALGWPQELVRFSESGSKHVNFPMNTAVFLFSNCSINWCTKRDTTKFQQEILYNKLLGSLYGNWFYFIFHINVFLVIKLIIIWEEEVTKSWNAT